MKRNKMVAFLNIAGLSLAFTVVFIVAIQVNYDFSYNKSIKGHEQIFRLKYLEKRYNKYGVNFSVPVIEKIASTIPELAGYGYSYYGSHKMLLTNDKDKDAQKYELERITLDDQLFHILSPDILLGDTTHIADTEDGIIITKSLAKRLYGSENPIGQIVYENNKYPLKVKAVMKDLPTNNTFYGDYWSINSFQNKSYSEWSMMMFAKFDPDKLDEINRKLNKLHEENIDNKDDIYGSVQLSFDSIDDIYFLPIPELKEGNIETSFTLLSIGLLIFLIGLFNLFNLQIALAPTRMHLFNTKRVLGLSRTFLRIIIVSESVLFVMTAILLSLLFVDLFGKTEISNMFEAPIQLTSNLELFVTITGVSILIAILIGLYPAFYATSYPIATVLKGSFAVSPQGLRLRRILLIAQFAISIGVLIIGGLIKSQHHYMQTRPWGIQSNAIVYLKSIFKDTSIYYDMPNALVNDLKANPNILDCTFTNFLPGRVYMGWGRNIGERRVQVKAWPVAHNFIDFFGLTLVKGEDFNGYKTADQGAVIVNENVISVFDIPDLIGQQIGAFDNSAKIVGIVKDFNFNQLNTPIEPLALVCSDDQWCDYILIKLTGNDIPGTFDHIRKVWNTHNQSESDITFLDDTLRNYYEKEANLSKIIFMLSIISLVISIMGVYGLILFTARVKKREIAIRRINGASTQSIIWLLQKGYLIPIGIASLIACPVSYLFIKSWLREYPYQVSINPLLFIGAILIIIIVSAMTMLFQCLRAANANPVEVIKTE